MDKVKDNIVKFIDCIIEEDYSKAHSFLETIINEKLQKRIKKAVKNVSPFVTNAKQAGKNSAFGGNFPTQKQGRKGKGKGIKLVKERC